MNRALSAMALGLAALSFAFYRFEKGRLSTKEMALIASLASLAVIGRIPFAAIPGFQPSTFIILVSGLVFGPAPGFFVGAVSGFASNILLGHGPWTIWQMLVWGTCGLSAGFWGLASPRAGRVSVALLGVLWGYLFGWMMNLWLWYSFVQPLSFAGFVAVNAASFPFDTAHAVGNVFFSIILGNGFLTSLRYFKKRLDLSRISHYDK